jgi:hypothetical protein
MADIYRTRDEIIEAYLTWLEAQPKPVTGLEPEASHFRHLLGVYHQAMCDPPEGVIGVGAITYAQHKLVEAQQ